MADNRQIERSAAAWLARRDAGAWSEDDQTQLAAWLARSVAHRVAFIRLEHAWQQSARLKVLAADTDQHHASTRLTRPAHAAARATNERTAMDTVAAFRRAGRQGSPARPIRRPIRYLAAAAMVLLVLATGWGWQHYASVSAADYQTAIGSLDTVKLADGSIMTLNSNSRAHVVLSHGKRAVDLQQGEAFFEVAKDPNRPFIVRAGNRRVTAVGTAFAVRRDDGDLRVVVTHGVVRLETDNTPGMPRQATALLPAGSVAIADASGVLVRSDTLQQARDFLAWRDGYLSFHNTTLADAVAEFNRYNTRKIIIDDPAVGAMRVGGNFRWSNVDAFARLLEQGFPIHVVQRDNTLVLQHR
mgnify:CR=1 FL=1